MSWTTRTLGTLAAATLLIAGPPPTDAAQIVTECPFTCTADCELASDVVCIGSDGIALANGADFDLKGHSLICDDPSNEEHECSGTAVTMTPGSTNSVVKDTGTTKGGIVGLFLLSVNCLNQAGSLVSGIVVDGADSTALNNCAQAENNVLIGAENTHYAGNFAIITAGVGVSGDFIRNNTIVGYAKGISVGGSKPVSITGNLIVSRFVVDSGAVGTAIAVGLATSSSTTVESNSVVGHVGVPIVGNATVHFSNNHCDVENPNCDACIASHYCANPEIGYCRGPGIVLKPSGNASVQFSYREPSVPSSARWVLVADYPEANGNGPPKSFIQNATGGTHTDLFFVSPVGEAPADLTFARCVLRAHMMADTLSATTAYLVMKSGATQSDGNPITVAGNVVTPIEYTRVMATNPVTGMLWNSDDVVAMQIGVKHTNTGGAVVVSDLQLDCE